MGQGNEFRSSQSFGSAGQVYRTIMDFRNNRQVERIAQDFATLIEGFANQRIELLPENRSVVIFDRDHRNYAGSDLRDGAKNVGRDIELDVRLAVEIAHDRQNAIFLGTRRRADAAGNFFLD